MLLSVLFALWFAAVHLLSVPDFVLPTPLEIVGQFYQNFSPIMVEAFRTLWTTLIGFGMGLAVGVSLGVAMGISRMAYSSVYPLLVGFNAVPKSAFVPILVVWFGTGPTPSVMTAFLLSFFPIAVNMTVGLATIEPELEDLLRSLGASRWDILFKVGFPRSLPLLFAACKVAISLAFVGTVISETVASDSGIGYLMMSASASLRMPLVFAELFTIGAMAMGAYQIFAVIEARTTAWSTRSQR